MRYSDGTSAVGKRDSKKHVGDKGTLSGDVLRGSLAGGVAGAGLSLANSEATNYLGHSIGLPHRVVRGGEMVSRAHLASSKGVLVGAPAGALFHLARKKKKPVDKSLKLKLLPKKKTKIVVPAQRSGEIAPGVTYKGPGTVGMRGNASVKKAFGRQSVAPVLARKKPAAGTRGRRFVTGDQNSGVIGKALNPEQLKRLANVKGKAEVGPEGVRYRRAIYSRHAVTDKAERSDLGGLDSHGLARATRRRGVTYSDLERHMRSKEPRGDAGGVFKGVLQEVAAARVGATAAPTAGKAKSGLTPAKSTVGPKPAFQSALKPVKPMAAKVGKRRYDPEDERRHRQGLYAGALGTGGALSTGYGVRGIRRDTKEVKGVPDYPKPGPRPALPGSTTFGGVRVKISDLPEEARRGMEEKAKLPQRVARWEAEMARHEGVKALKTKRGVILRPKAGGLLGGGVAAMAGAAALHNHRRDSRWD